MNFQFLRVRSGVCVEGSCGSRQQQGGEESSKTAAEREGWRLDGGRLPGARWLPRDAASAPPAQYWCRRTGARRQRLATVGLLFA